MAPIGVKFCLMVNTGPGQAFSPFGGGVPRVSPTPEILGLNFGRLTANISKTVNRRVTCQLQLNIISTTASKSTNKSRGSSPQGNPQIRNLPTPVWRVLCLADVIVIIKRLTLL